MQVEKQRFAFSVGRARLEGMLERVRQGNGKLEKFLNMCDQIATLHDKQTVTVSPEAIKSLLQYWQHADRVFSLFLRVWQCPCYQKHCAHLWLQHKPTETFEFRLLVLYSKGRDQRGPSWQQQGLSIGCMRYDLPLTTSAVFAVLPRPGPPLPLKPAQRRVLHKERKMIQKCKPSVR